MQCRLVLIMWFTVMYRIKPFIVAHELKTDGAVEVNGDFSVCLSIEIDATQRLAPKRDV